MYNREDRIKFTNSYTLEVMGTEYIISKGTIAQVISDNEVAVYIRLELESIEILELYGNKSEVSLPKDDNQYPYDYIEKICAIDVSLNIK